MESDQKEEVMLRSVALQTARSIRLVRERAHDHLLQAQETLRRSEERFRSLVFVITDISWTSDAEGAFVEPQPGWEAYTGQSWEECRGFGWLDAIHSENRDYLKKIWSSARAAPHPIEFEGRLWHKASKQWRAFRAKATPLINPEGDLREWVGACADCEEEKRAERTLRESAERPRVLFESVPVAVFVCDRNAVIQYYNPSAAELWGREPVCGVEQHCGSLKLWLQDGTLLPHAQSPMREVLRTGIPARNVEVFIERPDGSRLPVLVNFAALKDDQGTITGAITSFIDISSVKSEAKARLAAIVESSDDAIIAKNVDGVITSWNRGAERLFGYTPSETIGQPVSMLIPHDRLNEEPTILERIRRGEQIDHYETVRRRKDGVLLDISLTVSPVIDSRGQIIGASKIARDITARKKSEEALRQAKRQLENQALHLEKLVQKRTAELQAINTQMEDFIYTIAHDLRAPLRSMQGFSQLLIEEAGETLSKSAYDFAQRIGRSAEWMDALLRDLLSFSQFSKTEAELVPVNLAAEVNSVVSGLSAEIQKLGARVELRGPWPIVRSHASMLVQMVANLLSNALKFVPPGVQPLVKISAEERSGFVRVVVGDNGIGIAPEHQAQIFRPFTRLHGERYPGTGIGLAIVQKGAERMGGRAGVESRLGAGSEFWFELQSVNDD